MIYPDNFSAMEFKPNTPKVGIGVILRNHENKILLLMRQGSHGAGRWSLPGGHMELGEEFIDTCKREVLEEVGVYINDIAEVGFINHIFVEEKLHYVTLFFEAIWVNTQHVCNLEPDKCSKMEWFSFKEIYKMKNLLYEDLIHIISKLKHQY